MTTSTQKRKLTAILSADAQGYSRLMGDDEPLTVKTITACRKLFEQTARQHGGRIVNAPGDAVLAEFPSVVDAVSGAVRVQTLLEEKNAALPEQQKMRFRIGINLGDVIQKGKDLFGDGVNIAARVEAFAAGGGICITGAVFDQVKGKLDFGYAFMGEHRVKNISEPVRIYRVLTNPEDKDKIFSNTPSSEPASVSQAACIAVLPFDNFSGNREHDYFSLGFVEDLITDIAHFPSLQVISSYTSRKIDTVEQDAVRTAADLGVDYLLKGNLRRKGDQIRISTQLLATTDSNILWAERYDASMDDLFGIQDDIVARVVGAISAQIDKVLLAAARNKPVTSLAAYDCWLRGMDLMRQGTPTADKAAREIFRQALAIDPSYSRAYAGISLSYFNDWSCQLWGQWETTEKNAYEYALKAEQLDHSDYVVQLILGRILLYRRQFDLAEAHLDRSLALNANDADNLMQIATGKAFLGRGKESERLYHKAIRLNPYRNTWYHTLGSFTYFVQRKYEACIETALKGPLTDVWIDLPGFLAVSYAYTGNQQKATYYLEILRENFQEKITVGRPPRPDEIIEWMTLANPFKEEDDRQHLIEGLRLAGLEDIVARQPGHSGQAAPNLQANQFALENGMWQISFEGTTVQLPEVKGFHDLLRLLTEPGREIHCADMMGGVIVDQETETVFDDQARHEYETRIRDLQQEIDDAESMNDPPRAERAAAELDRLTEHLTKALGLGGRTRKTNTPVERARAAVTWRIRSAIRKIEAAHPLLGRHLTNAVHTGTFCSYTPEKIIHWQL